jgi:predicted amidohydrolase
MREKPTVLGDLDHNIAVHLEKAQQAADMGAEIVVFPELSLTGYLLKDLTADVALNVERSGEIRRLAEASRGISMLLGFVEEADDFVYYNSALWLEGGEVRHVHRKLYLPTYGMFDEERYFSSGGTMRAFDTAAGRAAVLICEDYWHPSTVYVAAQDGAVLHFYIANAPERGLTLPDEITSADIAERMTQVSSQLYGVYSIYANRVGYEDGVSFSGRSCVVSPTGGVVVRAGAGAEEIVLAEIDPDQVRRARTFFPLMGDERLDMVHRELTRIRNRRYRLEQGESDDE